jgi:hypothetical protein
MLWLCLQGLFNPNHLVMYLVLWITIWLLWCYWMLICKPSLDNMEKVAYALSAPSSAQHYSFLGRSLKPEFHESWIWSYKALDCWSASSDVTCPIDDFYARCWHVNLRKLGNSCWSTISPFYCPAPSNFWADPWNPNFLFMNLIL